MSEALNLTNLHIESTLWDNLAPEAEGVSTTPDEAFMDVELKSNDEHIAKLKKDVGDERKKLQKLAKEYCDDKEGALTSNNLDIYQDRPVRRDEKIEEAYRSLTETELDLVMSEDERDASSKRLAAERFADSLNPSSLGWPISHEVTQINKALKQLRDIKEHRNTRYDDNVVKGWLNERRDKREAMDELKSCGYNPNGKQSKIFSLVLQEAKAIHYSIPTKNSNLESVLGHKRACDYQEAMLLLGDERIGDDCRRALKESGYKKLPESWDDKDFSTSDIAAICAIARSCENKAA